MLANSPLALSLGNPLLRVPQRVDNYNVAGGLLTGNWNYDDSVLVAQSSGDPNLYWVESGGVWYGSVGFVNIPSVTKPTEPYQTPPDSTQYRLGSPRFAATKALSS